MTVEALSETGNDRIAMGANMSPFDEVRVEIDDLYEEAKAWHDGTVSARDVTEDVVREGYDGGYLERDCDAVVKLLGPPPLTRDEHLCNLGDADWHSRGAA